MDVKRIIYERNENSLIINVGNKCEVIYRNISKEVDKKVIYEYIESLLIITGNWQNEYYDTSVIDGDVWVLTINYQNYKTVYSGKALLPANFDAFENLNLKLLEEVQHE